MTTRITVTDRWLVRIWFFAVGLTAVAVVGLLVQDALRVKGSHTSGFGSSRLLVL